MTTGMECRASKPSSPCERTKPCDLCGVPVCVLHRWERRTAGVDSPGRCNPCFSVTGWASAGGPKKGLAEVPLEEAENAPRGRELAPILGHKRRKNDVGESGTLSGGPTK